MAVDWASLRTADLSVSERVVDQLLRLIEQGQLDHGDRIPSERELSQLVGVSRTSIREALRHLEMLGMVDRRRGRGTVIVSVQRPELGASMFGTMSPSDRVLREVMDLRAVVEPPIAERAASRGTTSQIKQLSSLVEQAERLRDVEGEAVESFISLDVEFHTALARMTQNPVLVRLLAITNEWMGPSRSRTLQTQQRVLKSIAAHRQILDAVRRRDAQQAGVMMALHLDDILSIITTSRVGSTWSPASSRSHSQTHESEIEEVQER